VIEKYTRNLILPATGTETFFLWGPRQAGKSSLLHKSYPKAFWIDLLKSEEFRRYMEKPEVLRDEVRHAGTSFVVIDEIQKVPALLNEVHWLYENKGIHFALCGSSARKVTAQGVNLLGGRGIRYDMYGLSASEMGDDFDLIRMLNNGYLPPHYTSHKPERLLNSYISTYLKEEIAAEGLVRKLPAYSDFLSIASLSDGGVINYSTIARETGVSSETIRGYFEILTDTLLGRFLPAYRRRSKRRTVKAPKFYFADVGVVNHLAHRSRLEPGSELFGRAFENWIFHELCAYNSYRERFADFFYWQLSGGTEVDFIVNHIDCAIECKSSGRITSSHLKGLRELSLEHPEVKKKILVCMIERDYTTEDGIMVIGYRSFINSLWKGEFF